LKKYPDQYDLCTIVGADRTLADEHQSSEIELVASRTIPGGTLADGHQQIAKLLSGGHREAEGSVIQTVSRRLKEELTFDRDVVTSLDWASYPILTFPEVPEIVIELIDRPTEKP
jgi:hypothetical protein